MAFNLVLLLFNLMDLAVSENNESMPLKSGSNDVILIASGVACAIVLLDIAGRYYWRRRRRYQVTHVADATTQTSGLGYDVISADNVDLRLAASLALDGAVDQQDLMSSGSTGYSVRRQTSRSSSRRSSFSRPEGISRSESLQQAITALQNGGAPEGTNGRGVHDILNDLVEAMRTNVQLASSVKTDQYPDSFRDKVNKLRGIKDDLDKLSDDVTFQALALVDMNDDATSQNEVTSAVTGKDALSAALHRRAFMRSQWLSLRRLLFCVDLQLRHSAIYQVFFEEGNELKRILLDIYEQMKQDIQAGNNNLTVEEYKRMCEYLTLLQTNVQDLVGRSPFVVPLRMRKNPITQPVPAKAICSLTSDKIEIHDGDALTILDNSNPYTWKVRHVSGTEASLPAVCCVIPPPDKEALLSAARLDKALVAVINIYQSCAGTWLFEYCRTTLQNIQKQKDQLLKRLPSARKRAALDQLSHLTKAMSDLFSSQSGHQELSEALVDLEQAVQRAGVTNIDDPKIKTELVEPLQSLMMLLGIMQGLGERKKEAETVSLCHGLEQYLDDETLDWVAPILQGADDVDGLSISVQHQETEIAETSSYSSSSGEVRQTFSIRGVIDPRTDQEMSIADAITEGILDPENGMYIHPITKDRIPIPVAMNTGLIVVEATETKKTKEDVKEVGLVTINVTRETRPYTIKRVRDPASDEEIPVAEAISKGFFNPQKGVWINPDKNEEINVKDAIDTGLIIVEYDVHAESTEPEVMSRTFAVYGVTDRKAGKRLPFHEASEMGIISKETGEFLDTKSGNKYSAIEAAKKGWIKVRVVDNEAQLDEIVNRNRSDSMDSLTSIGSSTE